MDENRWIASIRVILIESRTQQLPFLASSLAFHTFLSLLPAMLLGWIIAATLAGETVTAQLIGWTRQYLTPSGQAVIVQAVVTARNQASRSILGLVVLVWSVVRIVWVIDIVFGQLYGHPHKKTFMRQLRDGFVAIFAIGVAITAMLVAGIVVTLVATLPLIGVITPVLLLIGFTLVFLPLYYVFPPVPITIREVVPGAVVAAIGLALLQALFQAYVTLTTIADMFGVIGSVILVLLWLYVGAFILLLGIVVNVVLADRSDVSADDPIPGHRLIQRTRALLDRSSE
jgi:membrane protein